MSSGVTGEDASTHRLRRPAVSRTTAGWIAEASAIVAALAVFVGTVGPTLSGPLLEVHAFRQTQTAWSAREFHEAGFDLLHPKLPVFGEPFEVPFEFPLFQALAALPMELGLAEDTALRLTSLLCFVLTALLLWGLVRYVAGPVSGVAALVAFTFTPLALLWSRTSMIEYLATAGAVGFAFALVLWRNTRRPAFVALALAAGLVGMLVKPTTAVFWIVPALLYRPQARRADAPPGRIGVWTAVAVGVPLLAAALWTRHADAIKAASPVTEGLTGWNLRRWNFGRAHERLEWDQWDVILQVAVPNVVTLYGLLLVPAAIAVWRSAQWRFWLGIVSAAVLPILGFMNLYVAHDYYFVAVSPAVAALVGLGSGALWSVLRPRWLVAALPLVAVAVAWGAVELKAPYWSRIHGASNDPIVLPLAREIASNTAAGDLVATVGLDWSPAVLYYAHRRGHMVTQHGTDVALDLILRDGYRHLVVSDPADESLAFMGRWAWVGALAPHLYELADTPAQLPRAEVVATDPDPGLAARLEQAPALRQAPEEILCGRGTRLAAGRRGTWLRLGAAPPDARLFVGDRAPLPVRRAVFVAPSASPDASVVVTCTGAPALTLEGVADAPGPS
jgi:4-amino-4-deoxy-L-arabinose transferase-like glycosyltransferase